MGKPVSINPCQADQASTQTDLTMVIVDDHVVVREGTRMLLQAQSGFLVLGESDSIEGLHELLKRQKPQCVLLDVNLPGNINGIEALKTLRKDYPHVAFVIFSAYNEPQYVRKALDNGARGFLTKTLEAQELARLLQQVRQNPPEPVLSPDVAAMLKSHPVLGSNSLLTAREIEILSLVVEGKTNRLIADELVLSVKTVDTHVANLMKKLSANNRTQLTAFAFQFGVC